MTVSSSTLPPPQAYAPASAPTPTPSSNRAPSYKLINDFYGFSQDKDATPLTDSLSLAPYWVLAVFPFQEEVTFNRATARSYDPDPSMAVKTNGYPLIITSDCISLQVQSSKDTPIGNLQATMTFGDINYLNYIFPGDWCAAWILQSETDAQGLLKRIRAQNPNQPCNLPHDGFKFIGRVMSIGKELTQSAEGKRTVQYNLQASSFMEMESSVFFDPALYDSTNARRGNFLGKFTTKVVEFISKDSVVRTQKVVPFLMDLLLGRGLPPAIQQPDPNSPNVPSAVAGGTGNDNGVKAEDAPYGYLIPAPVAALIGKTNPQNVGHTLSGFDFTEAIIGVQKYTQSASQNIKDIFKPDGLHTDGLYNYSLTSHDLLGAFTPNTPEFTGHNTIWTLIGKYVNEAINERFVTLRVNQNGLVVPTLIIRQIPFTTNVFASTLDVQPGEGPSLVINNEYLSNAYIQGQNTLTVTRFLELPRWQIHPLMVSSSRLTRTDAARCNFVHIYGQPVHTMRDNTAQAQIVKNPPIQDLADMKRSGLRAHMTQVSCAPSDITANNGGYGPSIWMALVSDWRMGMHLDLTGTINMHGITAPICIGDNVEFDGVVGHIEMVLHTARIEEDGRRAFYTTVNITHGIRSDTDPALLVPDDHPDVGIYAATEPDDQTQYNPGLTYDAQSSGGNATGGLEDTPYIPSPAGNPPVR